MRKLVRPAGLFTPATLILFILAMAGPAQAAGPASTSHLQPLLNIAGPLTPPAAALQANGAPGSGVHALGFVPNPAVPRVAPLISNVAPVGVPASVDLSQYNPPVGDQGGLESCVSWATGYYLRGWYAKRDGYYPAGGAGGTGSYAPMYLYSQLTHGRNVGTYFKDNLNILQQQGIDTRADYSQGDYDNSNLPTAGETANAAHVKIASYADVSGPNLQNWIETTLAAGNPVVVGLPVYPEFDHASAANPLVGLPLSGETSRGGHAVFASKYDANGLWIENSWGTGYGLNGWSELSWNFVNQYVYEAVGEAPLSPGGPVPNVRGETPARAGAAVHAAGFAVTLTSAPDSTCNNIGLVTREVPGPGSWAEFGSSVTLTVGTRPRTPCP
jgi:papain like protease/PASTA domain-containing protein